MPLVLSLKEGQDFFVGDARFVIGEVHSESKFKLFRADDEDVSDKFDITDEFTTEIMPDVFVSAGFHPPTSTARVTIDAPSRILILRGDNKRNTPGSRP